MEKTNGKSNARRQLVCAAVSYNVLCAILQYAQQGLEITSRFTQGLVLQHTDGAVRLVKKGHYAVRSRRTYNVKKDKKQWSCDCSDHKYRKRPCKHMYAAGVSLPIKRYARRIVATLMTVTIMDMVCPECFSRKCIKKGFQKRKDGRKIQQYGCKKCGRKFIFRPGFLHMRHNMETIPMALDLYNSCEASYSKAQHLYAELGITVSAVTIYNWQVKYTALVEPYMRKFVPNLGDIFHADEIVLSIRRAEHTLMMVMDATTRVFLAYDMVTSKDNANAVSLLKQAKRFAGGIVPSMFVTDSLAAYAHAFARVFAPKNHMQKQSYHVKEAHIRNERANNNIDERFNGTARDFLKKRRGLKKPDSPAISGFWISYNFVRVHSAIRCTPAQMAGIEIQGKIWQTMIQRAALACAANV